ncbi:MAG: 2Fe-2S iron-sulfur cluster binding domain-containing protein [Chloroflexi bacterium]|nr:2Fe-2S iron-sulfur cluster binding domain-containing protein [Chloroflexota bacterium]
MDVVAHRVEFIFDDRVEPVAVREDEFILTAARRAGLELPSLCEQGWCITCACCLLSGIVDQSASRRYFAADRDAGFVLICTGRPKADVQLRPYASEAMRRFRIAHRLPVPRGTGRDMRPLPS